MSNPTTPTRKAPKAGWRRWLQGHWIVNQVRFLLWVAILTVVYIGNGHYADNVIRDTGKANRELKQLQYQYKTLQAELIYRSKESELAHAVEPLGLAVSQEPPYKMTNDSLKLKKSK